MPPSYRDRVQAMYAKYDPDKLPKLDKHMEKFKGQEKDFIDALVQKYGPEPPEANDGKQKAPAAAAGQQAKKVPAAAAKKAPEPKPAGKGEPTPAKPPAKKAAEQKGDGKKDAKGEAAPPKPAAATQKEASPPKKGDPKKEPKGGGDAKGEGKAKAPPQQAAPAASKAPAAAPEQKKAPEPKPAGKEASPPKKGDPKKDPKEGGDAKAKAKAPPQQAQAPVGKAPAAAPEPKPADKGAAGPQRAASPAKPAPKKAPAADPKGEGKAPAEPKPPAKAAPSKAGAEAKPEPPVSKAAAKKAPAAEAVGGEGKPAPQEEEKKEPPAKKAASQNAQPKPTAAGNDEKAAKQGEPAAKQKVPTTEETKPKAAAMHPPPSYRDRVQALYAKYDPDKLPKLDKHMEKFKGQEKDFIDALVQKYGPEPPEANEGKQKGQSVDPSGAGKKEAPQQQSSSPLPSKEKADASPQKETKEKQPTAKAEAAATAQQQQSPSPQSKEKQQLPQAKQSTTPERPSPAHSKEKEQAQAQAVQAQAQPQPQPQPQAQPQPQPQAQAQPQPQPEAAPRKPSATPPFPSQQPISESAAKTIEQYHATKQQRARETPQPPSYRDRVQAMYAKYDPDKLPKLDKHMERYVGRETAFIQLLAEKFGPEPRQSELDSLLNCSKEQAASAAREEDERAAAELLRLRRFYSVYRPDKKEEDIRRSLREARNAPGGYEAMWMKLCSSYGPEPTDAQLERLQRQQQGLAPNDIPDGADAEHLREWRRLKKFCENHKLRKSDQELDEILQHFRVQPGGWAAMWTQLVKKFGPDPPPSRSPSPLRGLLAEGGSPNRSANAPKWWDTLDEEHLAERNRLRIFVDKYTTPKTDAALDEILVRYRNRPGGWRAMWAKLTETYGPEPSWVEAQGPKTPNPSATIAQIAQLQPKGASSSPPRLFPPTPDDARLRQEKRRMRRFADVYTPGKTDEELDQILKRHEMLPGGWHAMWRKLTEAYGPESVVTRANVTPPRRPMSSPAGSFCWVGAAISPREDGELAAERIRLRRFVDVYDPGKSDADLEEMLWRYRDAPGGWNAMWTRLTQIYGPEPLPSDGSPTPHKQKLFWL